MGILMPTGILKKKAEGYKKINNSILLGSLENTDLTDVEVVTLAQYARDCAYRSVIDSRVELLTYEDIQHQVELMLNTSFNESQEFITIERERIIIGIDADKVDDRAIDKALLLLVEVGDFSEGKHYVFGDTIKLNNAPNAPNVSVD